MTYLYRRCILCKKIVVDCTSDYMMNHLDKYHPKEYKELANQQTQFDIGYAKLKEKFPLSQRGTLNFFEHYPDKDKLTEKQKKEIRIFSTEAEQ